MKIKIKETGEEKTLTYWVAGGQNHAAEVVIQNAPDCDLTTNEDGDYVMDQVSYDWWQAYLDKLEDLDAMIAEYNERFGADAVNDVITDRSMAVEFDDLPGAIMFALERDLGGAK